MTNIFVCHSSSDHSDAAELCSDLKSLGRHHVFLDRCNLEVCDSEWRNDVYDELARAEILVVVISRSLRTPYVYFEMLFARACKRTIVPVVKEEDYPGVQPALLHLRSRAFTACAREILTRADAFERRIYLPPTVEECEQRRVEHAFVSQMLDSEDFARHAAEMMATCLLDEQMRPQTSSFVSASSSSYARLIHQLPPKVAMDVVRTMLLYQHSETVRHALHLYGLLNAFGAQGLNTDDSLRELVEIRRRWSGAFDRDGGVLRQFDFTMAQLGSVEYGERFLRTLHTDIGRRFDIAFIYEYYGRNDHELYKRFKQRQFRPDEQLMARILDEIYRSIWEARLIDSPMLDRPQVEWRLAR